jgi:hypothetical protein
MQDFGRKTEIVDNAPWRWLFVDGEEEEGGRGRNRERKLLSCQERWSWWSRRVGRARLPSCVKNFSQGSLARGVRHLGIGCLQSISNVARGQMVKITSTCTTTRGRWFKTRILALDSKGRLLHLGRLCTASVVQHKAEEPEAECWWTGAKTLPANGAAVERREVSYFRLRPHQQCSIALNGPH